MKRKLPILLFIIIFVLSAQPIFATTDRSETKYLDDGSYYTTTIVDEVNTRPSIAAFRTVLEITLKHLSAI